MADVKVRNIRQHSGGNSSAVILDRDMRLGISVWDPARGQFAFHADNHDLVLSATDQASIVSILNALSR
jgi:hypothetical protein